jgi:hypothetical protein
MDARDLQDLTAASRRRAKEFSGSSTSLEIYPIHRASIVREMFRESGFAPNDVPLNVRIRPGEAGWRVFPIDKKR